MAGCLSMEANNYANVDENASSVSKVETLQNEPTTVVDNENVVDHQHHQEKDVNVSLLRHIVRSNPGCEDVSRVELKFSPNGSHPALPYNGDSVASPSPDYSVNCRTDEGDCPSADPVDESGRVQFEDSSSEDVHHVQFQECDQNVQYDMSSNDSDKGGGDESSSLSSSSSSEDGDSDQYAEARAPDGGWGWVIVFASFMVNLIADGITFSFGVIFLEFVKYFGEGKSKTAWIGSLFLAIPLLSGPIASYLTDRYGCRRVSIAGGILAATGFVISAFINSIELLFFTFGILSGFGLSLCYVAAIVIVAYYFEKRRSFATGLSVCGSGIGTFIFPPFMDFLIEEYGWRGTTLILAGLFLNLCVCGALMRDLEYTKKKRKKNGRKLSTTKQHRGRMRTNTASSMDSSSQYSQYHTSSVPSTEEVKRLLQITGHEIKEDLDAEPVGDLSGSKKDKLFSSLVSLPTFVRNGEKVPLEVLEGLSSNRHLYAVLVHNYPSLLISSRSISDSGYINEQKRHRPTYDGVTPKYSAQFLPGSKPLSPDGGTISEEETLGESAVDDRKTSEKKLNVGGDVDSPSTKKPEKRRSILKKKSESLKRGLAAVHNSNNTWWNKRYGSVYGNESPRLPTAYLRDLKVHRHSLTYRGAMLNIGRYRLRASSCPDIYRNSMTTIAEEKEWYAGLSGLWYAIADMMDFSYFTNVNFLLFAISNFLLYTWYDVPYVYLPDYAVEQGFTKSDSIYIISVIGILNMLGEIAFGWAGDRPWLNSRLLYAVSISLCGIFITVVPLMTSYKYICIVSGGFGFLIAANYSLTSIILVESISLERFTNAYGLLLLVQGVANLVGPPLAGWLYELTGNFSMPFYLAGFFISISGLLLELTTCVDKLKNNYKYHQSNGVIPRVVSNETLKSKANHCTSFTAC